MIEGQSYSKFALISSGDDDAGDDEEEEEEEDEHDHDHDEL